MSTRAKTEIELIGSVGGLRSEPGGRAERPAGGASWQEVRDRLSDEVIDELLAGARSEEEIVGPGGVLAQLTKRLRPTELLVSRASGRAALAGAWLGSECFVRS
jgi:hypothetical protein